MKFHNVDFLYTGDNVLTAISVSRECGLINKNKKAYIPRFIKGSSITQRAEIVWENLDDPKELLDSKTLKVLIFNFSLIFKLPY
jgi:cation-transporting P-type ATPase 13A2